MIRSFGTPGYLGRHAAAAFGFLVFAAAASAGDAVQAHTVRFIASDGDDADACTRNRPCLTLQRGIDRTPDGSELIILDSGDFGSGASIAKSITISAVGVAATISGGLTIDNPEARVVLQGLRLDSSSSAVDGISIIEAAAVHIEDCEIQGFGYGIRADTSSYPMLFVSGSHVHGNLGGLRFETGTPGRLVVDNSRFENNTSHGLFVRSAAATISRTIVSGNGFSGIVQIGGSANIVWTTAEHNGDDGFAVSSGEMTLEHSAARGNDRGLRVEDGGAARISSSVVTANATGLSIESGSTLLTRRNNTVSGNTADVSGVLTVLAGT